MYIINKYYTTTPNTYQLSRPQIQKNKYATDSGINIVDFSSFMYMKHIIHGTNELHVTVQTTQLIH